MLAAKLSPASVVLALGCSLFAQQQPGQQPLQNQLQQPTGQPGFPAGRELPGETLRPNYTLGPNDQIMIRAPEAEEINEKPFRIDGDGFVNLPLLGRFRVGGMTVSEFEAELVRRLREYIREPQAIVTVTQFRSEPVFFVGMFKSPGIYPLQGRRTLVEMLSAIGGLQPNASRHIKITRRTEYGPIPLPTAVEDPEKKVSTVEISLGSLRENINPAEDILLQPYDQISVERAEMVYISGEVSKIGAIELGERDSVSLVQALTQAGGFTKDASRTKVRILRPILNTNRRAVIEVDAKRVFEGKDNDIPLLPNDVLYVPRSYRRSSWVEVGTLTATNLPYILITVLR